MTNEEKLNYIKFMHELSIKYRIDDYPKEQHNDIALDFNRVLKEKVFPLQPLKLYKYRAVNDNNLDAIKNDYAWFSLLRDVDDTVDSTINFDPEKEVEELEANQGQMMFEYNLELVKNMFKKIGLNISEGQLRECLKCFDDGVLNVDSLSKLIEAENIDDTNKTYILKQIIKVTNKVVPNELVDATKSFINVFLGTNESIQKEIIAYCLSESSNIDLMWGTYADSSKGFCIEYTIPFDSTNPLSLLYRTNLYPVYYGKKDRVKLFDVLKKSAFSEAKEINGVLVEDYRKMFISAYTKDESWSAQKEWRITLPAVFEENNKQSFPYITSIILGERMSEYNKQRIMGICKMNNIPVYQRKFNISHSKIIVEKLVNDVSGYQS